MTTNYDLDAKEQKKQEYEEILTNLLNQEVEYTKQLNNREDVER